MQHKINKKKKLLRQVSLTSESWNKAFKYNCKQDEVGKKKIKNLKRNKFKLQHQAVGRECDTMNALKMDELKKSFL